MNRGLGDRLLLFVCVVLVLLVGVLAVVQYRWSARVATADAQREREHLESSATLFATKFNEVATRAVQFVQNDAWNAHQTGAALTNVPRIVGELYYLDFEGKDARVERLTDKGLFTQTAAPDWLPRRCVPLPLSNPPALVAPIYNVELSTGPAAAGLQVLQAVSHEPTRCFVARIDEKYLRDDFAPNLIRQSFGDSSMRDYDFAITTRGANPTVVYGTKVKPDVAKAFFSVMPLRLRPPTPGTDEATGTKNRIFIQRFESNVVVRAHGGPGDLLGDGLWELDVAHKGVPLEAAFERTRRRNLLLSIAVEALLVAAIVFLGISVRRMQRLAGQKMEFVATVSHELRTPVSSISMLSKNQADGLVTGVDRVRQYGELIHNESRRLSDMVEQTLQYAGMHSGLRRKQNNKVDLRAIVQQAIDARADELRRRNIEVEIRIPDDLPTVTGDANLLRTAIDNLLSNAEKHAGEGRWIRVSASHTTKEIIISVEDRGPGINPEDQAEIFEPFSRGSAAVAAQVPGSGLGLSLVRSAAEAHNGSVTLDSAPGRGSTFQLHLPI